MKKTIVLSFVLFLLVMALCACSASSSDGQPPANGDSLVNPITEYASLAEINEITGGHLAKPAVMGVTDEAFLIIDANDYKIAEYNFAVNGTPYTMRFAKGTEEDISGVYEGGGLLFDAGATDIIEVKEFEGGKAARCFNMDGQYILTVHDDGALDMETFRAIADELFGLAAAGDNK
ncbi:MAG: hypothetical protein K6B40_03210 [Firmicutes bacterium]|nr:hypothetical protein [Bacillota bacterium]